MSDTTKSESSKKSANDNSGANDDNLSGALPEASETCPLSMNLTSLEDWLAGGRNPEEWLRIYGERRRAMAAVEILSDIDTAGRDPNNGDLRYHLGVSLMEGEYYGDAEKQLRKTLELERKRVSDYEVFSAMASNCLRQRRYEEFAFMAAMTLYEGRRTRAYDSLQATQITGADEESDALQLIGALIAADRRKLAKSVLRDNRRLLRHNHLTRTYARELGVRGVNTK